MIRSRPGRRVSYPSPKWERGDTGNHLQLVSSRLATVRSRDTSRYLRQERSSRAPDAAAVRENPDPGRRGSRSVSVRGVCEIYNGKCHNSQQSNPLIALVITGRPYIINLKFWMIQFLSNFAKSGAAWHFWSEVINTINGLGNGSNSYSISFWVIPTKSKDSLLWSVLILFFQKYREFCRWSNYSCEKQTKCWMGHLFLHNPVISKVSLHPKILEFWLNHCQFELCRNPIWVNRDNKISNSPLIRPLEFPS